MSKSGIPYKHEELTRVGSQRRFAGPGATEVAFPIGGIGTGAISLGGRGNLRDFEIFGKPAKGNVLPFTFFALWAKPEGGESIAKVLEGKIPPPYRSGFGEPQAQLQGLPRFESASFYGEYPVASLELSDDAVPVKASLRAWNPLIPMNVKDSALPAAIFEWTISNTGTEPVEIALAVSITNPTTRQNEQKQSVSNGSTNAYQAVGALKGILLSNPEADPDNPMTGTLALTTTWNDPEVQTRWYRGGWYDKCHLFWDDFSSDGRLTPVPDTQPSEHIADTCSLVMRASIPAGGEVTIPVHISWLFPLTANPWPPEGMADPKPLDTYAGAHFDDAWAVAQYVMENISRLRAQTDLWRETIFGSTLPSHVLDAITSQASIMRSPTCFLLADGNFYGWEGCGDQSGCCHGNCTHVWNYEQAVAFLFPELERTMRVTEFLHNTRDTGNMAFRCQLPRDSGLLNFKPCADGQMGAIIQVYRDWQLSGDDAFLREIWPKVKLALEYAWTMTPAKLTPPRKEGERSIDSVWDPDKDGVMEGEQHNTYDIEFFGPNTMCTAMYLGALRACEAMARHLGEADKADEYQAIYKSGRAKVERDLWNGEYYIQKVMLVDGVTVPENLKSPASACGPSCACKQSPGGKASALGEGDIVPKYQYGEGCLSDQLLGQWACHVSGIGYILDREHVKKTLKSIFEYNFMPSVSDFSNVQRVYALNEEAGLLLCSWPHGNRPALPFVYSDEVWTGIEYQVAAHLIYEGWIEEGLAVVKAVRDRYAGYNRNPWNEVECGHHYARAMASWSVKLALDGYSFSMVEGRLGFAPKLNADDYRTFWSTGTGWGGYSQRPAKGEFALEVLYGSQKVKRLDLANLPSGKAKVTGPDGEIPAAVEGKSVVLEHPVTLKAGDALRVSV